MARLLGSLVLLLLLALAVGLPRVPMFRQGAEEGVARADVAGAVGTVGERLPDFTLHTLDGARLRLEDLRGHRVLLAFERSLDW